MNFIALDFETATHERNSACELGICVVENSEIVETKSWLIKPPSYPYFNSHNINVHGIYPEDVKNAPTFDEIWSEVEETLYGNLMIAHNASFDASVLRGCLDYYGIFKPKTQYLCSIQLAKKSWKHLESYGLKTLPIIIKLNLITTVQMRMQKFVPKFHFLLLRDYSSQKTKK
jgi:DNA polymerase-3 subunit epsilon